MTAIRPNHRAGDKIAEPSVSPVPEAEREWQQLQARLQAARDRLETSTNALSNQAFLDRLRRL